MGVTEGGLSIGVGVILVNCTIPFVIPGTYLTIDQPPPSTLVVYSTMQYSTIYDVISSTYHQNAPRPSGHKKH